MNFSNNIVVLLATYNGVNYLTEQLDSLLAQTKQDFDIVIHDDGSTDDTLKIIQAYSQCYPNKIQHSKTEQRFGNPAVAFLHLLQQTIDHYDYFLFCDQDDIWLPEKIQRSYEAMQDLAQQHPHQPLLVHSDLTVVDNNLQLIAPSHRRFRGIKKSPHSFAQLLANGVVTASTMMINRAFKPYLLPIDVKQVAMHDSWLALIASAFGQLAYIDASLVNYRQHDKNVIGTGQSNLRVYTKKLRHYRQYKTAFFRTYVAQARLFLHVFSNDVSALQRQQLTDFIALQTESCRLRRKCLVLSRGFLLGTG